MKVAAAEDVPQAKAVRDPLADEEEFAGIERFLQGLRRPTPATPAQLRNKYDLPDVIREPYFPPESPERRLMRALVYDAMNILRQGPTWRRAQYEDDYHWFAGDDARRPVTFAYVCQMLDLGEPEWLAKVILKGRPKPRRQRRYVTRGGPQKGYSWRK